MVEGVPYNTQDNTPPETNFRAEFIKNPGGHTQRKWWLWGDDLVMTFPF